ncbi:MAG: hypothetical protein K8I60_06355 [Anaerolineae bacterium]|nr:hypothetical protein [Anaerolineae bacterium]
MIFLLGVLVFVGMLPGYGKPAADAGLLANGLQTGRCALPYGRPTDAH